MEEDGLDPTASCLDRRKSFRYGGNRGYCETKCTAFLYQQLGLATADAEKRDALEGDTHRVLFAMGDLVPELESEGSAQNGREALSASVGTRSYHHTKVTRREETLI
jgi:hypothetical protein